MNNEVGKEKRLWEIKSHLRGKVFSYKFSYSEKIFVKFTFLPQRNSLKVAQVQ